MEYITRGITVCLRGRILGEHVGLAIKALYSTCMAGLQGGEEKAFLIVDVLQQ